MPGYVEAGLLLVALILFGSAVIWLVNVGKKIEKAGSLEDDVEAHTEAHRRAEEFDAAGGMFGAVQRARARRTQRLSEARRSRDV